MNREVFQQRVEQAALSLWELGDLLGIHPHHLHTGDVPGLTALPARVIIDLARRLDLHPPTSSKRSIRPHPPEQPPQPTQRPIPCSPTSTPTR